MSLPRRSFLSGLLASTAVAKIPTANTIASPEPWLVVHGDIVTYSYGRSPVQDILYCNAHIRKLIEEWRIAHPAIVRCWHDNHRQDT